MGIHKPSSGFTIIEVILFLAVSAALAGAVFATSAVGINNQRYTDAVNSFKALVQEEFINTTQVVNSRETDDACPLDPSPNSQPAGATECVIMGRLTTISGDGEIVRSNLIGMTPAAPVPPSTDIESIRAYTPTIDTTQQQTDAMNWGTFIRDGAVSIVIFRSPTTGNVLSFVHRGSEITTQSELEAFMNNSVTFTNKTRRVLCVDPSGWTVTQSQAIIITPYAAGPSGVEQKTGETACA